VLRIRSDRRRWDIQILHAGKRGSSSQYAAMDCFLECTRPLLLSEEIDRVGGTGGAGRENDNGGLNGHFGCNTSTLHFTRRQMPFSDCMDLLSSDEPHPSELADLCEIASNSVHMKDIASFSDDVAALHEMQQEQRRVRSPEESVVPYRSWKTRDIFHSEPREPPTSSPVTMPHMASSPPLTPSPRKKRKVGPIDLGESMLSRPAKAQRTYYGISIHRLLQDAEAEESLPRPTASDLPTPPAELATGSKKSSLLWTEKYRARKFTDLIGDERTHRAVMHWLKRWDQIVFPGSKRPRPKVKDGKDPLEQQRQFKKILMLTGPPGLGKTTLAHVCAKQAGYEVQEINASDERSGAVVNGRIRDMVGTENVRAVDTKQINGKVRKAGKPVCVVVDEVDGVVGSGAGGGGGGEGGFVKALIDLVLLDQRNSNALEALQQAPARKKKGDRFRLLRPLILICNDVYHPSLRPLRQSSHAEIIHVRKPQLQTVANRMQAIFNREGIPCETDGVRRLCEAAWGVSSRKEDRTGSGAGEGDMRGIMVVGEWIAGRIRSDRQVRGDDVRLSRKWVEEHVLQDLAHGGGAARGLGRGGPRDIVDRIFKEGAGFPKSTAIVTPDHHTGGGVKGVAEGLKRTASDRLHELINTHGDTDRIMTDCFSIYPEHQFQDDTLLSKPDAAYEWLHFHDTLSSAVRNSNEWELAPYLSTPVLAFHHLFATPTRAQYANTSNPQTTEDSDSEPPHPFVGLQASWTAHERTKSNESLLQTLQSTLSLELTRAFNSPSSLATDLTPYLLRMLNPNVVPVVVGGGSTASVRRASEQTLVRRSIQAMGATGVRFERTRVSDAEDSVGGAHQSWQTSSQWIYRMEPSIDVLGSFETGGKALAEVLGAGAGMGKQRYAVRQVLDQEWEKEESRRNEAARMARFKGGEVLDVEAVGTHAPAATRDGGQQRGMAGEKVVAVKRDFFGRPITMVKESGSGAMGRDEENAERASGEGEWRVWITYHEGYSNAVRKPITLAELMKDL